MEKNGRVRSETLMSQKYIGKAKLKKWKYHKARQKALNCETGGLGKLVVVRGGGDQILYCSLESVLNQTRYFIAI